MRFGAHYLPTYVADQDGSFSEFYRRMFEQIELLDELGYHDVWVTEHHFHEYGGAISNPPTLLSAAARTTKRIHLGIAVTVLPLHNPLQIAESFSMVDVISNGRLEFGVGRGSSSKEFEPFRLVPDETPPHFFEGTEIIRRAWSQESFSFHGERFDYDDIRIFPRPVQKPHPPIWVAANRTDDTFRWAGTNGYNLMTLPYMYPPEVLGVQITRYRDALLEAGHDMAKREVLGKFHIYVASSDEIAAREAGPYLDTYQRIAGERNSVVDGPIRGPRATIQSQIEAGNVIAGSPQRCIDIINRWREIHGLTTISGTFYFGGMPQQMALENIQRFAEEVMPAFQPTPARA